MDVEKSGTIGRVDKKRFFYFFRDVKQELKRVEWTSKEELKTYVKIVLISTLTFSMVIYGIDLVIQAILAMVNRLFG